MLSQSRRKGASSAGPWSTDAVTVSVRPPDTLMREPVAVMLADCADEQGEIQQLWAWFEDVVGPPRPQDVCAASRDLARSTYTTCTPILPDDEPARFGLAVGALVGGRFRRGRLRGDPPALYATIGPGFQELDAAGDVDRGRPLIEFYKRRDEVELWMPISGP